MSSSRADPEDLIPEISTPLAAAYCSYTGVRSATVGARSSCGVIPVASASRVARSTRSASRFCATCPTPPSRPSPPPIQGAIFRACHAASDSLCCTSGLSTVYSGSYVCRASTCEYSCAASIGGSVIALVAAPAATPAVSARRVEPCLPASALTTGAITGPATGRRRDAAAATAPTPVFRALLPSSSAAEAAA